MRITQRDIVESISGLRGIANDLTAAADSGTPPGAPDGTVLVHARSLASAAQYLRTVADELTELIPERKVVVQKDP